MKTPRILWAFVACLALAPRPAAAQAPVFVQQMPRYTYAAPAPRYVYRRPARRYAYAAPRAAYPAPTYVPSSSFGRYRRSVDAGRDPNWAAGRGLRLYKPWEY